MTPRTVAAVNVILHRCNRTLVIKLRFANLPRIAVIDVRAKLSSKGKHDMTRSRLLKSLFTALCVALLAGCAATPTKTASTTALAPAADRLVVLISVDGLAAYYLDDPKADMPTIRRLAREGARAVGMKCANRARPF